MQLEQLTIQERISILKEAKIRIYRQKSCICPHIQSIMIDDYNMFVPLDKIEYFFIIKYKPKKLNNEYGRRWFPLSDKKSRLEILDKCISDLEVLLNNKN